MSKFIRDLEQLNTKQLDHIYRELVKKTEEVHTILIKKSRLEHKIPYLNKWLSYAKLPEHIKSYYLNHCNIEWFLLENIHHNGKIHAWTCKWMLDCYGDYISFRSFDHHNLIPKHTTKIKLDDIITMFNEVGIGKDIKLIFMLTEYIIYNAIKTNPNILKITDSNQIFGKIKNNI